MVIVDRLIGAALVALAIVGLLAACSPATTGPTVALEVRGSGFEQADVILFDAMSGEALKRVRFPTRRAELSWEAVGGKKVYAAVRAAHGNPRIVGGAGDPMAVWVTRPSDVVCIRVGAPIRTSWISKNRC